MDSVLQQRMMLEYYQKLMRDAKVGAASPHSPSPNFDHWMTLARLHAIDNLVKGGFLVNQPLPFTQLYNAFLPTASPFSVSPLPMPGLSTEWTRRWKPFELQPSPKSPFKMEPLLQSPQLTSDGEDKDCSDTSLTSPASPESPKFSTTLNSLGILDGRSKRNLFGGDKPNVAVGRYVCNKCGKTYATSSNLSRHKQTHRSIDSSQAKSCPKCDKKYVSMPALSMHILTHDLKHKCTVCGKAFSRLWLLQGHMRSHTGEKPYICAHCGKSFADRSNLRAHMQTHSSFKAYECKRCHKSFALKSYLNKHYESSCLKDKDH